MDRLDRSMTMVRATDKALVLLRLCTDQFERFIDADTAGMRDGTLGLLDDDLTVQRALQLLRPARR